MGGGQAGNPVHSVTKLDSPLGTRGGRAISPEGGSSEMRKERCQDACP